MADSANIAIIGAGVVGMTVARILQAQKKKFNITLIADGFQLETVSTVAAGIFRPGISFVGPNEAITKKWINDSWYYWQNILNSPEASDAGIMPLDAYIFTRNLNASVTRNHLIEDLVPIYRAVDKKEILLYGKGWKHGSYFSTIKIDCERYLPWAEDKFVDDGGEVVHALVDHFGALAGKYDLVFNCTGLGAQQLCNDHNLIPIRGQVMQVKAPWVKAAIYGDHDTYIIPGFDGIVTLGGVRQCNNYNNNLCRYDATSIFDRCCEMLPSLEQAEVLGHKVGLRPHRVPVRVEAEIIDGVKVVHCYGHGSYGVSCAPGTAMDAIIKGMDILKFNPKHKL